MTAKIFLDFNATHPPIPHVLEAARAFYLEHFANSSGLSLESQRVNKRIEEARENIAATLGVDPRQIVFTSCGTESNNLLLRAFHRLAVKSHGEFRALLSPFEHPSVQTQLLALDETTLHTLPVTRSGTIAEAAWSESPKKIDCIAAMAVHNETGLALPVEKLLENFGGSVPFLVDCAQWLPKIATNAPRWLSPKYIKTLTDQGAYVTATGHKLGAGFGAGLVVLPRRHALKTESPLLAGGNQEHGLRAGSHNTEALIALELALTHKAQTNDYALWEETTSRFEALLRKNLQSVAGFEIVGSRAERAPGTSLLLLPNVPIDFLVMALDKEGITVSTGTSCKSRSRSPSAALLAMGYSERDALSVVRLSYPQTLGSETAATVAAALAAAVDALK